MKRAILALLLSCAAGQAAAQKACRQALVLGLDVSGSVDAREYRLQIGGLAQALNSKAVRAALLERPEAPVELMIFEWSGPRDQLTLVPWSRIADPAALDDVIQQLHATERRAEATPGTALGVAMLHGAAQLAQRSHCWRHTLDISGDGKNNDWPVPRELRRKGLIAGMRINALVIARDDQGQGQNAPLEIGELAAYFQAEIIQGPDAFVEVALGFEDYARAMKRKLLRELTTRPIGSMPPHGATGVRIARQSFGLEPQIDQ